MENKTSDILNELKTISPFLANLEKVNVFKVPDNYFDDLDKKISTLLFLHQDEKNSSQRVPEGYFDSLSDRILSKIKKEASETATEEIKEISPALHYLKEEQVFTIPENYFDNLSNRILDKIHPKKAKVISIKSSQKWWKYTAAAVIAGVLAISSLQIFNQKTGKEKIAASYIQVAQQYKTPQKLDEGIASLSADEIAKYLEKTGTVLDEDVLIKDTDTTNLPSAADYLTDENALDNFLNRINSESTNKQ
ncbi:MAG TPA: hypothetical protein VFU62_07550 [Hanamia sp.]|nr:hypothetical protein [Hanamia sp.]